MALLDPSVTPVVAAFLLAFAVFYFLLGKSGVFGKDEKVPVIVAIAIAVFAASYQPLVAGLQGVFPIAIILLLAVTAMLFLRDVMLKIADHNILPTAVGLVSGLGLLAILWDDISTILPAGIDPGNVLWIIGIVVIVLLFYVIYQQNPLVVKCL